MDVNQSPPTNGNFMQYFFGRVLCWTGIHDYRVISVTGSFGRGGGVEKRECRRCQKLSVRPI